MDHDNNLLDHKEAAARLDIHPSHLATLRRSGKIKAAEVSGEGNRATYRYAVAELERYRWERDSRPRPGWRPGRSRKMGESEIDR